MRVLVTWDGRKDALGGPLAFIVWRRWDGDRDGGDVRSVPVSCPFRSFGGASNLCRNGGRETFERWTGVGGIR